jgi:hypothetical protein
MTRNSNQQSGIFSEFEQAWLNAISVSTEARDGQRGMTEDQIRTMASLAGINAITRHDFETRMADGERI